MVSANERRSLLSSDRGIDAWGGELFNHQMQDEEHLRELKTRALDARARLIPLLQELMLYADMKLQEIEAEKKAESAKGQGTAV